jgi:PAP2 superfamily
MRMTSITLQAQHVASQTSQWLRDVASAVRAGFQTHLHFHVLAGAVYVAGIVECLWLGLQVNYNLVSILSGSIFFFIWLVIAVWLLASLLRHILWRKGGSPLAAMAGKLRDDILSPVRVSNALHVFFANGMFITGFMAIKKSIPVLHPFAFDASLMQLDKTLHFGTLPHQWLSGLLASPPWVFALNVNYNMWFLVLVSCMFWFGFAGRDSMLRQRYLLSYFSSWILGTLVLGSMFSSAGPCFYGFVVTGENPYAPLMASLSASTEIYPIWALTTQDALWASHLRGSGNIEGVSAMPSLHVASSVLLVLLARAHGVRWFKWFTHLFAAGIFTGSIVLGWHYAADGYAGAALALFCWWASGKFLSKRFPHGVAA